LLDINITHTRVRTSSSVRVNFTEGRTSSASVVSFCFLVWTIFDACRDQKFRVCSGLSLPSKVPRLIPQDRGLPSLTHKLATFSYTHTILCFQHTSLQAWHCIPIRFRVSLYKSKYGRQYFPPLSATTHRASRRNLELLSPASGERNGRTCQLDGLRRLLAF
jgi:hypothetical protein